EMLNGFSPALSSEVTVALSQSSEESEVDRLVHSPTETVDLSTVIIPLGKRERYELLRVQGEGGLGRVWVARDQSLGRVVALKEIRKGSEASLDAIARFQREAQITSRLEHPNIVLVYDWEDGESRYYTMRLVHGHTLDDAIKNYHRQRKEGKATRLKLQELLTAFLGVCQAVSYAHARGVIHRDIKPANVLLGEYGEVILLDWGLARSRGDGLDSQGGTSGNADSLETHAGEIMGTPAFMAPEQARGKVD
ncbi:MAG: serine/threonine protein kinase, partial [Planctomycetaceae bacterium]|nr:serine/threonine protein kinase [Planctomycetaceae bacterium]